jgi:hypothetical protein
MGELVGKLTNVSYELFAAILPGMFVHIILLLYMAALGPVAEDTFNNLSGFWTSFTGISEERATLTVAGLIWFWYILGHLLLWYSRSTPVGETRRDISAVKRFCFALLFKPIRPSANFATDLQPLYEKVAEYITKAGGLTEPLKWSQFYPIAKAILAQHLRASLVVTYQNKYTFHRSLATASAAGIWGAVFIAAACLIFLPQGHIHPDYGILAAIAACLSLMVWGFADGFNYHWGMWGNTIVTETYTVLFCMPGKRSTTDDFESESGE